MPLAERVVERPRHIIGQAFRPHLIIEGVFAAERRIPFEQWDALLARVVERLPAGGILLVKEHDPTARIKNVWNRWQESLATKLGLTLGESFSYETPADFTARLKRAGFRDVEAKRIDSGYPHAHMLYVARK